MRVEGKPELPKTRTVKLFIKLSVTGHVGQIQILSFKYACVLDTHNQLPFV